MIYTIILNPALNRILLVNKIENDVPNKIINEARCASGKGIDVSIALANLGITNCALGFLGGKTGKKLEKQLIEKGIITKFIQISEETRVNILLDELNTGTQILFNCPGPHPESFALNRLIQFIRNEIVSTYYNNPSQDAPFLARATTIKATRADQHAQPVNQPNIVTIGGSLPPGVPTSAYTTIINIAREKGATVILDADGDALRDGIEAKPDIIKPNLHELRELVGRHDLYRTKDIFEKARMIHTKKGIRIVLVSLGSNGIILVSDEGEYMARIPSRVKAKARNTVGAGDSAIAGFIYGIVHGMNHKESLICAAAAGTATTMGNDTSLCQKEDFDELVPLIREHLKIYQEHSSGTCKPSSG